MRGCRGSLLFAGYRLYLQEPDERRLLLLVEGQSVEDAAVLVDEDTTILFAVVRAAFNDGRRHDYALPLGLRRTGYSWAEIGMRLAISRQAAQQRWGH